MAKAIDILLDSNFDLKIENGDFVMGDGTDQHQHCLLMAAKGDFKQFPNVGVDVFNYLNDERPEDMMREIRLQLTQDGMKINKMELVYPSNIKIDATY